MVDVCASNQKLVARAVSIVCCATGVSPERARGVLDEAGFSAKTAIVMILCGVDAGEAMRFCSVWTGKFRQRFYRGGRRTDRCVCAPAVTAKSAGTAQGCPGAS